MHSDKNIYRDIILILNLANIYNLKILNLVSEGTIYKFGKFNMDSIIKFNIFDDDEVSKIENIFKNIDIYKYKHTIYKNDCDFITIIDENYPEKLKQIYNPPSVIYYKGDISILDNDCIGIVGTRKPTKYGKWITEKIVSGLKGYNIALISGMAMGIDGYSFDIALKNDIKIVGVLASSLDLEYPKSNSYLYEKMKDNLLISEFPFTTNPLKLNFVLRNRIISGLSVAIIVIEAAEKSGSLITANYALEQNRDIFAVPGNVDSIYSFGTNNLIKNGAKVITQAEDLIENLKLIKEFNVYENHNFSYDITDGELEIIELLKKFNMNIDEILSYVKFDLSKCYTYLVNLEMKGIIKRIDDYYILTID